MLHLNRQLFISLLMGAALALPMASFAEVGKAIPLSVKTDANGLYVLLPDKSNDNPQRVYLRNGLNTNQVSLDISIFYTDDLDLKSSGNFGDSGDGILFDRESSVLAKLQDPYYAAIRSRLGYRPVLWAKQHSNNADELQVSDGFSIKKVGGAKTGVIKFNPSSFRYNYLEFKTHAKEDFPEIVTFDDEKKTVTFNFNKAKG